MLGPLLQGASGVFVPQRHSENFNRTIQDGLGLVVIAIGLQYALKADNWAVLGISLALGAVVGEWRRWEPRLQTWGDKIQQGLQAEGNRFIEGFIAASLLFINGCYGDRRSPLEDGLTGNYHV